MGDGWGMDIEVVRGVVRWVVRWVVLQSGAFREENANKEGYQSVAVDATYIHIQRVDVRKCT